MARAWTSAKIGSITASGPLSRVLPSKLRGALVQPFEPVPGTLLTPRLRLVRPVADGRKASTWLAEHLALATPVEVTFSELPAGSAGEALALALAAHGRELEQLERITREINEPHLVQIIERGEVKGIPFIVTEALEGRGLRQRLLHGPASLELVRDVVLQASAALAKAHALGFSHGHLAPDCLFEAIVAQRPFLKIAGFGGSEQRAHGYSSPEQLLLGIEQDAGSDVWALTVTLYELLTTTLPFEAPTASGVTVAICNGQFAPPSHYRADLPPALDAWFTRALAKDPAQRFGGASELARGFLHALSEPASVAAHAGLSLERGEEDERTLQFDLPEGWSGSLDRLGPPALPGGSRASASASAPPLRSASSAPGEASARARSSAPAAPLPAPPSLEPAVYMDSPFIASVASALVPDTSELLAPVPPAAPSRRVAGFLKGAFTASSFTASKAWLAAAAFVAGVAVTWVTYEPAPDDGAGSAGAVSPVAPTNEELTQDIRTLSVEDLPRLDEAGELPAIIKSTELPPVLDEGARVRSGSAQIGRVATPQQKVHALASSRSAKPAAPPSQRAPATDDCSPPYFFDPQGIRRLKAKCLAGSGSVSGPYGAVIPTNLAATKAAANSPANDKGGSCNPPYYFDGSIRRIKQECL